MYQFIASKNNEYSISPDDISAIEKKFGIIFPEALKTYYLQFNCADTILCGYTKGTDVYEVDAIYPIKHKYPKYMPLLENLMERDRKDGYIPYDMIPFAADQSEGCYYCHSVSEQIFLVLGYDVDNPILICNSFVEFISSLISIG
ncbi:MAG: SMI1/KNR4 family protein [Oscillibacter sp.]|nr:SMI1/KNR4 family protein [Oscillibacter sp.]